MVERSAGRTVVLAVPPRADNRLALYRTDIRQEAPHAGLLISHKALGDTQMLNEAVNECVRTSNKCAALCIQRARARFAPDDPTSRARRIALEREDADAWQCCVLAFRRLARRY